jgi:hypothetical protein
MEIQRSPDPFQKGQRIPTPGVSDALARLGIEESLCFMTHLTDIQLSPRTKATCTTFGTNTHKRFSGVPNADDRYLEKRFSVAKISPPKKGYASSSKLCIDSSEDVFLKPALFYGITLYLIVWNGWG